MLGSNFYTINDNLLRMKQYAMTPSNLYLSATKDSLLHAIAADEWPAAAYAKSLLYLIKGEWIDFNLPVLPRESGGRVSESKTAENIIKVYPNPADHSINIENLLPETDIVRVDILNYQGGLVRSLGKISSNHRLDISALDNGTYLLRIVLSDGTRVNKLVQIIR